jgi:hypothetical protein
MDIETALTHRMIGYFGADARRIHHALKVVGFARTIAAEEGLPEETLRVLLAVAVLHDIGIHEAERKYGSSAGKLQEKEGPAVARTLLDGLDLPDGFVERVCFLVGHHHTVSAIDGPDFQVLVEADFLVNAYEEGMDAAEIQAVGRKVFRTASGLGLLCRIHGFNPDVGPPTPEEGA